MKCADDDHINGVILHFNAVFTRSIRERERLAGFSWKSASCAEKKLIDADIDVAPLFGTVLYLFV